MRSPFIFAMLFLLLSCEQTPDPVAAEAPPVALEAEILPATEQRTIDENRFTFDHYAIIVKDLEAASNFYLDVVGLKEIHDATEKKHIRWFGLGPKMALHVIEDANTARIKTEKPIHLSLTVKNFSGFVGKMRALEMPFQNWPGQADTTNLRPDGVAQIYFQDPDGYWIEVNDAARF